MGGETAERLFLSAPSRRLVTVSAIGLARARFLLWPEQSGFYYNERTDHGDVHPELMPSLFKIALVLVCLGYVARFIEHANDRPT